MKRRSFWEIYRVRRIVQAASIGLFICAEIIIQRVGWAVIFGDFV
jgi:hypothetical protein